MLRQTKPSGEGAIVRKDLRLRLSDEGMGKQVKMEGVERSDAVEAFRPSEAAVPASI